jgi:hypothetical protein
MAAAAKQELGVERLQAVADAGYYYSVKWNPLFLFP